MCQLTQKALSDVEHRNVEHKKNGRGGVTCIIALFCLLCNIKQYSRLVVAELASPNNAAVLIGERFLIEGSQREPCMRIYTSIKSFKATPLGQDYESRQSTARRALSVRNHAMTSLI